MTQGTLKENFYKALSYELVVFADSLVPSKEFEKAGKKAFQTVSCQLLELLEIKLKHPVT